MEIELDEIEINEENEDLNENRILWRKTSFN